jgi:tetratricopeptide (TPR) repeat protein
VTFDERTGAGGRSPGAGQSEARLRESVRAAPDDARARDALARWLYRHRQFDEALDEARRAAALAPGDAGCAASLATMLLDAGNAREVLNSLAHLAAAEVPDRWVAHLYARAASSAGREEQALAAVERALRAPGLSPGPDGRAMLHFDASNLLDRLGRHDEAFEQARLANESVGAVTRPHDPAAHTRWISRSLGFFTPERLKALPRATHGVRRPVFIVGMPRSGTSLVEQVLACHPQVHGAGELNALRLAAKATGETYPEALAGLSAPRLNELANQYLSGAGGPPDVTYVTDKQPLNFLLLGLVNLLFPGSHVIHCVRSPLDTCVSCYMTNFERSNEFKYDLANLGAYYRQYERLTGHWKSVLTVPMLEVRYEDVVHDMEGQTRRMLEFLGLPWDERCLRYYESGRRVRTASTDQVRRPIYTSSIGRWKLYEKHLGPLIAALGESAS